MWKIYLNLIPCLQGVGQASADLPHEQKYDELDPAIHNQLEIRDLKNQKSNIKVEAKCRNH
jgi:hypothetical protein